MARILWRSYDSASLSVKEANELEHHLGRALLRLGLGRVYGRFYSEEEWAGAVGADPVTGKPFLADHFCEFSISHTEGCVACALAPCAVGADVERIGYFPEILVKKALSEGERRFLAERGETEELRNEWFYRFWTLKEAYGKRTGRGVDGDLTAVEFYFPEGNQGDGAFLQASDGGQGARGVFCSSREASGRTLAGFPAGGMSRCTVLCSDRAVSMRQYRLTDAHILSVCTEQGNFIGQKDEICAVHEGELRL